MFTLMWFVAAGLALAVVLQEAMGRHRLTISKLPNEYASREARARTWVLLQRQCQVMLRRPQNYVIFSLALIAVTAMFAAAYQGYAEKIYDANSVTLVAPQLLNLYRMISLFAIFLFAPIMGVNAVMQERDAGTLDLILATATHPLEFVFSKIAASMIVLSTAIVASAPLLGVTFLMGGVGPDEVLVLFVLQLGVAAISISIGLYTGAAFDRFFTALITAYIIVAVCGLSPCLAADFGQPRENPFVALFGVGGSLAFISVIFTTIPGLLAREVKKVKPIYWRPIPLMGKDM
ncbi:MAG: hypothetical protein GC154_07125 [bacterium]|nr:hypothetical protein [bacterium]